MEKIFIDKAIYEEKVATLEKYLASLSQVACREITLDTREVNDDLQLKKILKQYPKYPHESMPIYIDRTNAKIIFGTTKATKDKIIYTLRKGTRIAPIIHFIYQFILETS